MAVVNPGEVYFDRLDSGLYEKCVLQKTAADTPDRMTAARGGTGEFYKPMLDGVVRALLVAPKGSPETVRLDAATTIFDLTEAGNPKIVFLERVLESLSDSAESDVEEVG